MKIVRSSKHSLKFSNKEKREALSSFIDEYRRVAGMYINYLWKNKVIWNDSQGRDRVVDIKNNNFDIPSFLDKTITNNICIKTKLSARALSNCRTQVCSMLKASVKKQSKRLYICKKIIAEGDMPSKQLIRKVRIDKPTKPRHINLKPEINSICCDLQETEGFFDAFLQLKSIGKRLSKIRLPIKYHKQSNKWLAEGKLLTSFLINKHAIDMRYEIEKDTKQEGSTVGADQGMLDVLTLSDGQVTTKQDIHHHTLQSIINKLSRKRKGSKAFARAQAHRKNFVNWSINQLNLSNIKQLNVEKIWNIRFKSRSSRTMSHWTNTLIRDKLYRACEEQEVLVKEQASSYRSQRCSSCGIVRKSNRKGKQYICKQGKCLLGCGASLDADLNAARNHEQNLQYLSWEVRRFIKDNKLNLSSGFLWKPDGIFDAKTGEDFIVPLSKNKLDNDCKDC